MTARLARLRVGLRGCAGIVLTLALSSGPASAETIYRCGNSYGHQACANGRSVETEPSPDETRVAEAEAVAIREAALADTLDRERARERSRRLPGAAGFQDSRRRDDRYRPPPHRAAKKRRSADPVLVFRSIAVKREEDQSPARQSQRSR